MNALGKTPQPGALPPGPLLDALPFGFAMSSEGELVTDSQDLTLVTCMHLVLAQTGGEGGLEALLNRLAPSDERLDVERAHRILTDPAYIDGEVTIAFPGARSVKRRASLPISVPEVLWRENQDILLQLSRDGGAEDGRAEPTRFKGPRMLEPPIARALARGEADLRAVLLGAHPVGRASASTIEP
jgi:hypothetical protein